MRGAPNKYLPRCKIARLVGFLASILLLGGCGIITGIAAPTPAPPTRVPYTLDQLHFSSAEEGQRFRELDRCARDMAGQGWRYIPYDQGGNFYRTHWCTGTGAPADCQMSSGNADYRDQHMIELETLFYDMPEVFGLILYARWVPPVQGWGAAFSFAENGKNIMGEGFSLNFDLYGKPTGVPTKYQPANGKPDAVVNLGDRYEYTLYQTQVQYSSSLPLRENLARYLASPEAMRDHGLEEMDAAAETVQAKINSHTATRCEYGPYKGGGIPPVCTPRLLTAAEEQESLAKARAYWDGQKQLLREHYQEMYAALLNAFPLDRCWP